MTVTDIDTRPATTRPPGRPPADPEQLEAQGLHRVADLAVAILRVLREPGRGSYSSERQLRGWLADGGVPFSANDLRPALELLTASGLLERPRASLGQPRPGRLPIEAETPVEPPGVLLGRLVMECVRSATSAQGSAPTFAEIAEQIAAADEDVSDEALAELLRRLVDCGRLRSIQRAPSYPMRYAGRGVGAYDVTDDLAASVCAVLRSRTEIGYVSEDQLKEWMLEAGVEFDERLLQLAIGQLLRLGRLQTPRAESWRGPGARPTWLIEAEPYTELLG